MIVERMCGPPWPRPIRRWQILTSVRPNRERSSQPPV